MKPLQYYWYHRNLLVLLLLPVSWLYCLITGLRRKLYQLNIKKSYSSQVAVVVVGNIVVGGSGKTPLLLALCDYLRAKGHKPGVVSRGYGGSVSGVHQVEAGDSAASVGDEPLMIFQRANLPTVVGADRVAAVNHLLQNNNCDVVLSDDGLQHYRMRRSYEIAVIDSSRRFGNGYCLPAGPLREPRSRLNDVDMLVFNDTDSSLDTEQCSYVLETGMLQRLNSDEVITLAEFSRTEFPTAGLSARPVHAVAGIGNPERFFQTLRQNGIDSIEHAFPDHHAYSQQDFSGWSEHCIIMTEKDAVKCRHLQLPDSWVLSVTAVFSETLETRLNDELLPLI